MLRCSAAEAQHELVLRPVRVLELVHENVQEPAPVGGEHVFERIEEVDGDHEKVVEVHRGRSMEALLVLGVDVADAALEEGLGVRPVGLEVEQLGLRRRDGALHRSR